MRSSTSTQHTLIKNTKTFVTAKKSPPTSKLQTVNRCNYCLVKCGISWRRTISTELIMLLGAFQVHRVSLQPPLPLEGGGGVAAHPPQPLNRFNSPNIPIKPRSPSKGRPIFMERYRSVADIHQMSVIPDHKFLGRACSRCLFLPVCLNVPGNSQQSDDTLVPPPWDSVRGQATLFGNKSV